MIIRIVTMVVCMLVLMTAPVSAQSVYAEREFSDPRQKKIFDELVAELRCLVCQNQNIADSNAELAQDLRREVHTMLQRGDSKKQIINFMVERYGEFVLYRPLFSAKTVVLWLGPFIFFLVGVLLIWQQARKSRPPAYEPDEAALTHARELLAAGDNEDTRPDGPRDRNL